MKRVIVAVAGTITGLVMLLSFKTRGASPPASVATGAAGTTGTTGTTNAAAGDSQSAGGTSAAGSSSAPGSAASSPAASSGTSPTVASGTRTVTGNPISTRYGPVEVQITVSNGQVAQVTALEYPTATRRDQQINAYAIPALNQEALAAKSYKIDMISGATYTSVGYIDSLQSALNKAGLA